MAIHPRSDRFATAGVEVEVKIMSTEVDNFGEETGGVSGTGTGTFGLELVYVSSWCFGSRVLLRGGKR